MPETPKGRIGASESTLRRLEEEAKAIFEEERDFSLEEERRRQDGEFLRAISGGNRGV